MLVYAIRNPMMKPRMRRFFFFGSVKFRHHRINSVQNLYRFTAHLLSNLFFKIVKTDV